MSAKPVTIIGAGRAGKRALEVLTSLGFNRIRAVDPDPGALESLRAGAEVIQADGIDWLSRDDRDRLAGEWIVPTLPIHLAFAWLLAVLGDKAGQVDVPIRAVEGLPGLTASRDGGFTISLAQGLCRPDCDERKGCAWSKAYPVTLPQALGRLAQQRPLELIRSRTLAPGLGGFPRAVLDRLKTNVQSGPGQVIVATACRCHGVIHALELTDR